MKKVIGCALLMLIALQNHAQISLSAEIRPRAEFRNGYKNLNTADNEPAAFVSQRTRLGILFTNSHLNTSISFQDVRVWGDESLTSSTGVFGDDASVDLNEAWVEKLLSERSSVKIGRQYFDYDDSRLLATRNWNQHSISYDALLYRFKTTLWQVDAAVSLNNEKEHAFGQNYPPEKMKTLDFVRAAWHDDVWQVSTLGLISGHSASEKSETVYLRASYGFYIRYFNDWFDGYFSGYYQHGKNQSAQKVGAYNLNISTSYRVSNFLVTPGFSLLSGNDPQSTSQTDHRFDLLYGARHRYYGEMDYFSNVSAATGGAGLADAFLSLDYRINRKTSAYAAVHYFANQHRFYDPENQMRKNRCLAREYDFGFSVNFSEDLNLKGGFALLKPSSTLEAIQNTDASPLSSWAWLQLTVRPSWTFSAAKEEN